jgi:hypothetical protein
MNLAPDSDSDDEQDWRDLAQNQPGQAIQARADELRRAAPVKSLLARLLGVRRDEWFWRAGAQGERLVAKQLGKLKQGWYVLHSVPVGERGSDIDHVVIGPPGVFTLNAKNFQKGRVKVTQSNVYVNGQRRDYLRNSRHEARRAARLLTSACHRAVAVAPVIVVIAERLDSKGSPEDVDVVGRRELVRWLSQRPAVLSPEDVEEIYNAARRDTTWREAAGQAS